MTGAEEELVGIDNVISAGVGDISCATGAVVGAGSAMVGVLEFCVVWSLLE